MNQKIIGMLQNDTSDVLIIDMPPRHGKSEFISKYFPAWFIGTNPSKRVILTSYEATFAASFGAAARDLLKEHGPDQFGVRVRSDSSAAKWWRTQAGGGMTTSGVGGPITGKGADLLIVDDAIKNAQEALSGRHRQKVWDWFASTALTRLEPGGKVIIVMTRWHEDDLVGRLLKRQEGFDHHRMEVVSLPAIAGENDALGRKEGEALWPERYSEKDLAAKKLTVGDYWWSAVYQQKPRNPEGAEWPDEYFEGIGFDQWPDSDSTEIRLMSFDPSKGKNDRAGDYSSIILGYGNQTNLYVSCIMKRLPVTQACKLFVQIAAKHRVHVAAVETNQFQELLIEPIQAECERLGFGMRVVEFNNTKNKVMRIRTLNASLAGKKFRFRKNVPGVDLLLGQLRDFPLGQHDDGPDSLEMADRLWRREMGLADVSGDPLRIVVPGAE